MSGSRVTDGDPDELIECPFDPVHLLRRKRMPYHIIKCSKNFNMKNFKICPFNYRHIVAKEEFESHMHHCQDRGILEREIMHNMSTAGGEEEGLVPMQKGYTDVPVSTFVPPVPQESWDDSNVIVDIPSRSGGLFLNEEPRPRASGQEPPRQPPKKSPSKVREVPTPRAPVMTRGSDSEVFKLATAQVQEDSPPRPKGRGRGRGHLPSPKKDEVGGAAAAATNGDPQLSPRRKMAVGRGRGVAYAMALQQQAQAQAMASAAEEAERKKEKKLRKMLRQIVELEEKVKEGQALNEDQLAKISRKEDVLSMLEQFHI